MSPTSRSLRFHFSLTMLLVALIPLAVLATALIFYLSGKNVEEAKRKNYTLGETDVSVSHILTRWPGKYGDLSQSEKVEWLAREIRGVTPTTRPAFLNVMALSWGYRPSDIVAVCRELGDNYVPVSLPDFDQLIRTHEGY